jgi:hypothetical protein
MKLLLRIYLFLSIAVVGFLLERLFKCYMDLKFKTTVVTFDSTINVAEILKQILEEYISCIYILLELYYKYILCLE